MGLAAYMDLVKPKYKITEIMHCEECGHPQDTLCGWEEGAFRWVCPECYGELKEERDGRERAATDY